MNTEPQDPSAGADTAAPDDSDAMAQVTPIRRVETVATAVTPIYRDPRPATPPAKPQRVGIGLTLQPFVPTSRPRQMRTMSDLVDMAQPVRPSMVAKRDGRHVPATPENGSASKPQT